MDGIPTAANGTSSSSQSPHGQLAKQAVRDRVLALWKKDPTLTGKRLIVSLGFEDKHLLKIERARQLLKECRRSAAKGSSVHKRVGWWLDGRTAARIRITAICKRHPEYTAMQVQKALAPKYAARIRWINQIMNECWGAVGQRTPRQVNGWTRARRKQQAARIRQIRPWKREKKVPGSR